MIWKKVHDTVLSHMQKVHDTVLMLSHMEPRFEDATPKPEQKWSQSGLVLGKEFIHTEITMTGKVSERELALTSRVLSHQGFHCSCGP